MKIGTDITVVGRIEKSIQKFGDKFIDRFLTKEERDTLNQRVESIAGYWASKEAVAKALGCGIGAELSFHDIIIYKDEKNAPHFRLSPTAQKYHKIKESSLSIAHDGGFAIAVVAISQ
jgi:holo-[acyl-carrier protein] synthase